MSPSSSCSSPTLILVGGWMDAREPHLAKYTTQMQALFPDASILLVRSFAYHFLSGRFPGEIQPAVPLIRSILAQGGEGDGRTPRLLVHVFSNGGSTMLKLLYGLYLRPATGENEATAFPQHVTIFDSAPGRFQYSRTLTAFTLSLGKRTSFLSRVFITVFAHIICSFFWILHMLRPGPLESTWAAHNDRAINPAETQRTYIYSKQDALVEFKDIEAHAAHAQARGYDTRLEEFVGTAHVAHVRGDEDRYWRIVRETWDGRTAT